MKLINESSVPLNNRAFNYGDGLFETIAVTSGRIPLLKFHLARLTNGCTRLQMDFKKEDAVELADHIKTIAESLGTGLIKVTIVRESGGRGYRPKADAGVDIYLQEFEHLPALSQGQLEAGVEVRECQVRLATQPILAGLKHLNRLENVLARNEWQDETIFEGLLLDYQGLIIEVTQANIFLNIGDRWLTPDLSFSGVAGVYRQYILESANDISESFVVCTLSMDDLEKADACFVCNSVYGIVPVRTITGAKGQKFQYDVARSLNLREKLKHY